MVKHKFIDQSTAAHFHLVHRSQRDPRAADPDAPQRVLAPLPETGNQARKSVRGTQSTRAILQEQDLDGFDEAMDDPAEAAAIEESFNDLGLPAGYDYDQHLRPMGTPGGQFIAAPASVASLARSRVSQATRHTAASARSKRGELLLREEQSAAFASVDELEVGVSGDMEQAEAAAEEKRAAEEAAMAALGDDVWSLMKAPWEEDVRSEAGMDDDFVLQASRDRCETELLRAPPRKPNGKAKAFQAAEATAAATAAAAEAAAAKGAKKANPFAELFGSMDDDEKAAWGEGETAAGRAALATGGAAAVRGSAQQGPRGEGREEGREVRLIDQQFARLMQDYEDEDIGELDEDDPSVQGKGSLAAFEDVIDGFLSSSALARVKPAIANTMAPDDFGPITRHTIEAHEARQQRLHAQSDGLERVESGQLRCKGREPRERPPLPVSEQWSGAHGEGEGGCGTHALRASVIRSGAEGLEGAEGVEGAEEVEGAGAWDPRDGIEGGADEPALSEDPRAAETAVPIEDHPFLSVLKEGPRGEEWDAETILSTYTTTENHPSIIRLPRKGKPQGAIHLDPRSGLPVGTTLPGAKLGLASTAEGEEGEGEEGEEGEEGGVALVSMARLRGETTEEKRQRKQAAKEHKQARRHTKKQTKLAFKEEKGKQLDTHARTKQLPACPL